MSATTGVTLDAGALIAIEKRNHRMQALLDNIERHRLSVAVPTGVIAQVWRGGPRQARVAKLLADQRVEVVPLDDITARAIGLTIGRTGHPDVVDASVAVCARERGHRVVTTDPDDIHTVDGNLTVVQL